VDLKEKALALRKQGLTYAQISSTLDGAVSVDWCKRNLKSSTRKDSGDNSECVSEIIKLGERPEGVTQYEANGIIFKYFPEANDNKLRYIKDRAKTLSDNCIIHTGWIDYMKPNESHKAMNAFAIHPMDQVDAMVEDYTEIYPNTNKWSVRYEMLKLAFSKQISPESLSSRINSNEVLAERMETRNK
jgi:hypothetical protein